MNDDDLQQPRMDGISRIVRIAALLEMWLDAELFPFPKMKVKVLERTDHFLAIANVSVRNIMTGHPEYICGLGDTIDQSINDLLSRFVSDARSNSPTDGLKESDFEWSAPEDF